MSVYECLDLAALLRSNRYPGRGIVAGCSNDGRCAVSAYFIMGRSANSRNRIFAKNEAGEVRTEPFDASRVEDPSLIIYNAVRRFGSHLILTNGDQTDTIYDALAAGCSFAGALMTRQFEPDAPNLTPRISAQLNFAQGGFAYEMAILKSADEAGTACTREFFCFPALPGVGHFLHTYAGDGNPLPSFTGEPERVAIGADFDAFAETLWQSLDSENKISLYVRSDELATGAVRERIFNRNV